VVHSLHETIPMLLNKYNKASILLTIIIVVIYPIYATDGGSIFM